MKILVMGVSGCGKSSLGRALASELGLPFFDADDFHSEEAVAKMACGQALSDVDREPWLERLAYLLAEQQALVLGCSALKKHYRHQLREAVPELHICYLQGCFATIQQRMEARQNQEGHFFTGGAMLRSQFEALEEPEEDENPFVISIEQSITEQVRLVCELLAG